MDNPVKEIEDVVRSITEPHEAIILAKNVEKYFTQDAYIIHPVLKQFRNSNGREDLKGIYKFLRILTVDNKIDFHAVMFNEDQTKCTIELTEFLRMRYFSSLTNNVRFLVRVDLEKCPDGKYRINRQEDNFPSDITQSGQFMNILGINTINDLVKGTLGLITAKLGLFFLYRGWFGP